MDKLNIGFTSKIKPIKPINEQFTLCKCYVMALGKNKNKTNIPKEAVDDALPSLFNIPVVAHLFADENSKKHVGGHDMELIVNEKGELAFHVLTVPYGTVPQQDDVHYEEVVEDDGKVNTYLVADIILWTGRYPELLDAKYSDEIYFAQSMEIIPSETKSEEGLLTINKFQFSALCLLGKSDNDTENIAPCFASARIEPYDFAAKDETWTKLFGEFKQELAKCFEAQSFGEGGKKLDKELIASILAEYGFNEEDLPFEITDDMTEEELRAKLDELKAEKAKVNEEAATDAVSEDVKEEGFNAKEETAGTKNFEAGMRWSERGQAICEAFDKHNVYSDDYYEGYFLLDFDDKYAYADHIKGGEHIERVQETVRVPYSITDKVATVDVDSAEIVRLVWLTEEEEAAIAKKDEEFAALAKYKKEKIEEERMKEYAAAISEFSDIAELDEYKELVKNAMTYSSKEDLQKELYAIRGKNFKLPSNKKPLTERKFSIEFSKDKEKTNDQQERAEFMKLYLSKN